MFLFFSKLLPLFLYPIGFVWGGLLALLVFARLSRFVRGVVLFLVVALWFPGTYWGCRLLVRPLESAYMPVGELPSVEGIVVLGGGLHSPLPPRVIEEVSEEGDRVYYGAYLYHQHKAPWVLVTGGRIDWRGRGPSEADDMAQMLQRLGVKKEDILLERESLTTFENAVLSSPILAEHKIKKILLVTSALHMPRAVKIFQKQGLTVIPAPTDFRMVEYSAFESYEDVLLGLIPMVERLELSTKALKEYIGLLVYRMRGWL